MKKQITNKEDLSSLANSKYRYCPKCFSRNARLSGDEDSKGRIRHRCVDCGKNFVIKHNSIDLTKLFDEAFDKHYKGDSNTYMRSTKYRKNRALSENKEVQNFLDKYLLEGSVNKIQSYDKEDLHVFFKACELADKIDTKEINKHLDSWYYILNQYDMDVTYYTKHYNWILARRYDVKLSRRQNIPSPLLHCAICGSSNISTDGFNNNARRRIRCNTCSKKSLIRINNIIKESDAYAFFRSYLQQYTRNFDLIFNITEKMVQNFHMISASKHFDSLLAGQKVITHNTKHEILQASIAVQILMKSKQYKAFDAMMDLPNNLDSFGHVKPDDAKAFGLCKPKTIGELKTIELLRSKEEITFDYTFYQVTAIVHNTDFYGWRKPLDESFELAKRLLSENNN